MKRLVLFLTFCSAMSTMAQTRQKTYTFDFSKPESLILLDENTNPGHPFLRNDSLKSSESAGDYITITKCVFYSEDSLVTLSFDRNNAAIGAELTTDYAINNYIPYLSMGRFNRLVVTSISDQVGITSLRIPGSDQPGGLVYVPTRKDLDMRDDLLWYEWISNDGLMSANFENAGVIATKIHQIVIGYDLQRDNILPVDVTLADGDKVSAFSGMSLTFASNMNVTEDAKFKLVDANGNEYNLSVNIDGNTVTLSTDDEITTLGDYTLTVKGGSLADSEDFRNQTLTYHFTIVEPVDTYNPIAFDPTPGKLEGVLPSAIVLTFESTVGFVDAQRPNASKAIIKDRNGNTVRYCIPSITGDSEVTLTFTNEQPITEAGLYTLVIPEALIYNNEYDGESEDKGVSSGARYNKTTTVEYIVGENDYPSSAVFAEASSLLENEYYNGVGYPAADSPARTNLEELVENGIGTDAMFKAAIEAFYAETSVTKPATGNYYKIAAVAGNGSTLYLQYDGSAVSLTPDTDMAAAFKATANEDGTTTFATLDGKYLHQLVSSNIYTGTSMSNLTTAYAPAINNLTLDRLIIEGYSARTTFGLFSIYGSLGTNVAGKDVAAYALVNVQQFSIITDPSVGLSSFGNATTNGFRITEIDKSQLPLPDVAYLLSPTPGTKMERLTQVIVSFPSIETVTLTDASKIYLRHSTGLEYENVGVKRVEGTTNEFAIDFTDISAGTYSLIIEKGVFTYLFEQTNASVQAITATYTVTTGVDFAYDFLQNPDLPIFHKEGWGADDPLHDVDVNHLTFFSNDAPIAVSNQDVVLMSNNTYKEVARGHFVVVDPKNYPDLPNAKGIITLVLDEPIVEGSIPADTYAFVIPAATFGDVNFGKYLAHDPTVEKSDCHVNAGMDFLCTVDNEKADVITGIAENSKVLRQDVKVYDLQGRRMEAGSLRPGIYVKDGRKFVVK